jgi:chemotaxis protein MotB
MSQQEDLSTESTLPPEPADKAPEETPVYNPTPPSEKAFALNSFIIEDSFYRARSPRPVHWSVAWSDLMMTMFILFLSMFVYQASHEEFLVSNTPEVIGGSTIDAIDILSDNNIIVPIIPLSKNKPVAGADTVKKIEKVHIDELDIDDIFRDQVVYVEPEPKTADEAKTITEPEEQEQPGEPSSPITSEQADIIEPAPLGVEEQTFPEIKRSDTISDMYDMSRQTISDNKMKKFASLEVVPDKTMRIILTGDLLFFTGQAELSRKARQSLTKLAAVIKKTPYMINVIGHTDNQPMHSSRFATNWELSVVRASSVARFLIEEMGMDSKQFIVSGYGSNRPRRPNTNVVNRAANRRVEIIISKRPAPAVKATAENLL